MAESYVITLRKGGCGKTTTAVNLAVALGIKEKKVLLVDLDPQANATLSVGINPMLLEHNINDLFLSVDLVPENVIQRTEYKIDILPSHPDLAKTEAGMTVTQIGILRSILEPLENRYDYIIIDTPPSENFLSVSALSYAKFVLIPLQAHFLAIHSLAQAMEDVAKVKRGLNPDIEIKGILFTMVNTRTNIAKSVINEVQDKYGDLVLPIQISYSIKHVEATLAGVPMIIFDPKHQSSIAYIKLAEVILNGQKEH